MLKRIITAAVALVVFIVVLLLPPVVFTIALAAVIFMMLYECYSATKADTAMKIVGFISAVLIMGALGCTQKWTTFNAEPGVIVAIILSILVYMALVVKEHGKRDYKDVLSSFALTMYIVMSMSCLWLARETFGTSNMVLIFVCAWSCDTFAYFAGRFFGKHKLIPHVSPKKTVEGLIGGILGSGISCIVYLLITNYIMDISTIWLNIFFQGAIIGVVGGVLSQLGDLTASAIKRDSEIKDFGWIFPGHGGFMDRFDSVIYIAPILYGLMCIMAVAILGSALG